MRAIVGWEVQVVGANRARVASDVLRRGEQRRAGANGFSAAQIDQTGPEQHHRQQRYPGHNPFPHWGVTFHSLPTQDRTFSA